MRLSSTRGRLNRRVSLEAERERLSLKRSRLKVSRSASAFSSCLLRSSTLCDARETAPSCCSANFRYVGASGASRANHLAFDIFPCRLGSRVVRGFWGRVAIAEGGRVRVKTGDRGRWGRNAVSGIWTLIAAPCVQVQPDFQGRTQSASVESVESILTHRTSFSRRQSVSKSRSSNPSSTPTSIS